MICPRCSAGNQEDDVSCRHCGADLTIPSTSLVTTQSRVPTVLQNPQLPRLAAGVGAVAVGVGIELLRRGLLSDVHAPPKWRVIGPLANIPEFYEAFGVTPGQPMWLADEAHVRIW